MAEHNIQVCGRLLFTTSSLFFFFGGGGGACVSRVKRVNHCLFLFIFFLGGGACVSRVPQQALTWRLRVW
jgi:hypothetical protein